MIWRNRNVSHRPTAVIDMNTEKPDSNHFNEKAADPASTEIAHDESYAAAVRGLNIAVAGTGENLRRRLVKGALTAAPVVLTLRGQSALAATGCASPSRIFSGNLSPGRAAPPPCGAGLSPGYWKTCQHLAEWVGLTAPTFKPSYTCSSGVPDPNGMSSEGAIFSSIFQNTGGLGAYSCWRILAFPAQVDKTLSAFDMNEVQLARHLIATYLNFKRIGATFPVSLVQMQAMWNGRLTGYCPIVTGCSPAQLWTAQTIVCYLRNYTMDQVSVGTDPITWVCTSI